MRNMPRIKEMLINESSLAFPRGHRFLVNPEQRFGPLYPLVPARIRELMPQRDARYGTVVLSWSDSEHVPRGCLEGEVAKQRLDRRRNGITWSKSTCMGNPAGVWSTPEKIGQRVDAGAELNPEPTATGIISSFAGSCGKAIRLGTQSCCG
jgi:hypothetical protein